MDKPQNRIAMLRKRMGISQTILGQQLGVTQGAVSLYEKGENMPSRDALFALAKLFDVTIGYLLGTEEQEEPFPEGALNPALPPLLRRMMSKHQLRTTAQTLIFTNGVITARELDFLLQGGLPIAIEEERLVNFFRKFDFDLVRQYFKASRVPLPCEFEDLDSELRELVSRVATSTDNSAEALDYVVKLTREIFGCDDEDNAE